MLKCCLSNVDPEVAEKILKAAGDVTEEEKGGNGVSFRVEYVSESHRETARIVSALDAVSVIFIGMRGTSQRDIDEAAKLDEICTANNRDHYVIYVLPSATLLVDMMPNLFNVTGVILPPADGHQIRQIFRKIAGDYRLMTAMDGDNRSPFVALKYLGSIVRLNPDEIRFVEAQDKKLQIHRKDKELSVYDRMDSMHKKLGNQFFHCHRSYLVNCSYIYRIDLPRMEIELFDGMRIPISRTNRAQAQKLMERMLPDQAGRKEG